jgi:hypothetical protein
MNCFVMGVGFYVRDLSREEVATAKNQSHRGGSNPEFLPMIFAFMDFPEE